MSDPREAYLDHLDRLMITITDPEHIFNGSPLIATSVMLYKVCDNDPIKFEEACRLVGLFMQAAYAKGQEDAGQTIGA